MIMTTMTRDPFKVENPRNARSHPQGIVAKLKSKKGRTAVLSNF